MKVLVDTNIVLDVILKRQPFYEKSVAVFRCVDQRLVCGCLSSSAMTDIFYLLRKAMRNSADVYPIMDDIVSIFSIVPVFETTITDALALRWKDFEDAVQFTVALENGITHIVTRNEADYKSSNIHCLNPTDFIAHLKSGNASGC